MSQFFVYVALLGQSATVGRDLTYSYQSERGQDKLFAALYRLVESM